MTDNEEADAIHSEQIALKRGDPADFTSKSFAKCQYCGSAGR